MTSPTGIPIAAVLAALLSALPAAAKEPRVEGERLVFALPDVDGNVVKSTDERFTGKVVFSGRR